MRRQHLSPPEIERALTVLAHVGGNSVRASEITGVPDSTLRVWRLQQHAELYADIMKREAPKLEQQAINQARELALKYSQAEHALADRVLEQAEGMDGKDAANAIKAISIAKGVNIDKALVLEGRPTNIQGHLTGDESIKALKQQAPWLIVDSTAEEIHENPGSKPLLTGSHDANARDPDSTP